MRLLRRTLLKIVFIGTVIIIPIFHYDVLLSRSEKYNLHDVSGSTKVRSRGTGGINTAIIQRKTTRLKKPQATELRVKFFIAFSFGDQLTRATENLLALSALARYGNRSVAVPFVKYSMFYGTKPDQNAGTLYRYFDLIALNQKLHSYCYGLLKGWANFLQHCSQSHGLDVLLYALTPEGHNASNARLSDSQRQLLKKTGWTPCFSDLQQTVHRFKGFNVNQTICFDPEIVTSVQQLESDVLRGARYEVPFSRKLVKAAQEFAVKQLGNSYISVHIRSEWVLRKHDSNTTYLLDCFRQCSRIQDAKQKTGLKKIFIATDLSSFGSESIYIQPAQEKSEMLLNYLDKLLESPHAFDPRTVELSDRGSVAIVEMNILSAGKKLFLAGGGNFEDWIRYQFEKIGDNVAEEICYWERSEINSQIAVY